MATRDYGPSYRRGSYADDAYRQSHVRCPSCNDYTNLPISLFCSQCLKPLLGLNWFHFSLFVASILSVGFLLGYYSVGWLLFPYAAFFMILYLGLVLRNSSSSLAFHLLWSYSIVLFLPESGLGLAPSTDIFKLLALGAAAWLAVTYVVAWYNVCDKGDYPLVKGTPILSLTLLVVLVSAFFVLQRLNPQSSDFSFRLFQFEITIPNTISLVKQSIDLRLVSLGINVAIVMFLALLSLFEREAIRPEPIFRGKTRLRAFARPPNVTLPVLPFVLLIIISNVMLRICCILIDILKSLANLLKVVFEWVFKLLINYAHEFLKIVGRTIELFIRTIASFLKDYAARLALCLLVALQSKVIVNEVTSYILHGQAVNIVWIVVNGFGIFVETTFVVWLVTKYKPRETAVAMSVTNIPLFVTLMISILISSILLTILTRWIERLPYREIGPFTKWGLMILGIGLVISFFASTRLSKRRT